MEKRPFDLAYYRAPRLWTGRVDGMEDNLLRWHQTVKLIDLSNPDSLDDAQPYTVGILGFSCDEGVCRNRGRVGAAAGPTAIRNVCANLPCHDLQKQLIDLGDIYCAEGILEAAQEAFGTAVGLLLKRGIKPLLLGGGHEIAYAHYLGLKQAYPGERLAVINLDAHFDLREVENAGATSGTGFWQIAQQDELNYLAIGIQKHSNTKKLFEAAEKYQVQVITYDDFHERNESAIIQKILDFASPMDRIYLTIDLDVFSAAYAPGVSAPASIGIIPDHFFLRILDCLFNLPQLTSIDIAEYNPTFDQDERTAKLASNLLFRYLQTS